MSWSGLMYFMYQVKLLKLSNIYLYDYMKAFSRFDRIKSLFCFSHSLFSLNPPPFFILLKGKTMTTTHNIMMLVSSHITLKMPSDNWWSRPKSPGLSVSLLNWGLVSSDHRIFCVIIPIPFMCHYATALTSIFSFLASLPFRPEFNWLLSFQQNLPLQDAVCSSARAVCGAVLWLQIIFGSSLEVSLWLEHQL